MEQADPFRDGDEFLQFFLPGTSPVIRELRATIYRLNIEHKNRRMVPSILLLGEPGVGKGYAAHAISAHLAWLRQSSGMEISPSQNADVYRLAQSASLRVQTLTNLPENLAEATLFGARKGAYTDLTRDIIGVFDSGPGQRHNQQEPDPFDVFLDEIGDASAAVQAKLLQILEDKTFRPLGSGFDERERSTDARVIMATNRDLPALVHAGSFREDLYNRILWAVLQLPPLRNQIDQLPVILGRINASLIHQYRLEDIVPSDSDIRWAQSYRWPGNHRELRQVLWEWHLFHGSRGIAEIVQNRPIFMPADTRDLEALVLEKMFDRFEAILDGREVGFPTYGAVVDELKQMAYTAMYRFNKEKRLTDQDLERLFCDQKASNVRKQISENRSKGEAG